MKIFLTGGGGMVGRNVRERAEAAGDCQVVAPLRSELDLRDAAAVTAFIRRVAPDIVIHTAGRVGGIQANMAHPVDFLVENLDIGRNVVLGAREAGVPRLINLGSSCIYPREAPNPLREEMLLTGPFEPTNEAYAIAKITVARLCEYISREEPRFAYKTVIPCNLYGRWDKFDPAHSHLLAAIIHKLHAAVKSQAESVEIWGPGTARREFLYAGDVGDFLLEAARRFDDLPPIINLGAGEDHEINHYYEVVAEVIGFRGSFTHDLSKPVGMLRKLMDVSRLSAFGWSPKTPLREGVRAAYEFYKEHVV